MVQSQWGPVHLFDVCLWFDHLGMALALAAHGVPGCVLEDHHLGPISRDSSDRPCSCQGWDTCQYCCWVFPVEQGIWMADWDVHLIDLLGSAGAIPTARKAAATPLTHAMLDLCSCDMELPFTVSPKAIARLLDIAILTGNRAAAVNLSRKCQLRPLRRWAMTRYWGMSVEKCWEAARTALLAGADFQDLMVKDSRFDDEIPFPQALFLKSKLEVWQDIRHLLPRCHDVWKPRNSDNDLGKFFLEMPRGPGDGLKLFVGKIRAAEDAGVEVRLCSVSVYFEEEGEYDVNFTLLDMAIWYGQPDVAEACVEGGIELEGDDMTLAWHKGVWRGERLRLGCATLLDVVPSEAQTAAAAAGRAWLKRGLKSESSQKGIVLYQFMLKMFKGRSFPMVLVQEILTFSMPVPKIIYQLDLWAHVGDWMASIYCGPFGPAAANADGTDAKVESARVEGPIASDEFQQCTTTSQLYAVFCTRVSNRDLGKPPQPLKRNVIQV